MLKPFLNDFLAYCKNLNLAQNSVKELLRYIRQFDDYLQEQRLVKVNHITYKHVVNYATKDAPAPTTVKARIWALKKFISFLHLNEHLKDNIAKDLNPPKIPKKGTLFLTEKELETVIKYAAADLHSKFGWRNFVVILLMALMGFRKSSVVLLNREDIDLQNGRIFIKEKGYEDKRPVQIPSAVLALLREYMIRFGIQSGPLFLNNRKKRMRPDGVNKIVYKIKKELLDRGYDFAQNLHPHLFRHSAATQLNEAAGLTVTKEILGHRNVQNTRKYIHLAPTSYGAYMKRHPYFSAKGI